MAIRDAPCAGHPWRYSKHQLAYHYTGDRDILRRLVAFSSSPKDAPEVHTPAYCPSLFATPPSLRRMRFGHSATLQYILRHLLVLQFLKLRQSCSSQLSEAAQMLHVLKALRF